MSLRGCQIAAPIRIREQDTLAQDEPLSAAKLLKMLEEKQVMENRPLALAFDEHMVAAAPERAVAHLATPLGRNSPERGLIGASYL